ncbi:Actin-related protein 6 [Hondaea fermentalgiana]|uniref:Actin-related protein 6 n=1 Tax=Hondaea fermentalgiana TaxID=2315210 RepID=A0A2R5FZA8_9STRA|nr:Actin-related protein 6 [Hondaea fermentalgiana]|eukprot:GBG24082.1 Actin-related protein 6 [Hondaea fermentalgiana]
MWLVIDNGGHAVKSGLPDAMRTAATEAHKAALEHARQQPKGPGPVDGNDRQQQADEEKRELAAAALRRAADSTVLTVPNCTARGKKDTRGGAVLVGQDTEKPPSDNEDVAGRLLFTRSLERGYLINLDTQQLVWEQTIERFDLSGAVTGLVLTTPAFVPQEIQTATEDLVRSNLGIKRLLTVHPAQLAARDADAGPFCIVVDAGFSFTHVVPLMDGRVFEQAVRRIDVGGKLLTNYLRELVSYGQVNLQDETQIVDVMKRQICYVSTNIDADLAALALLERQPGLPVRERIPLVDRHALEARFTRRYVLPDFQTIMEGYPLPPNTEPEEVLHLRDQMLALRGECFMVPELLFEPSNLGMRQAGLVQVIQDVVDLCPRELRPILRKNILLTGGSTLFPNFAKRLSNDLGDAYNVRHVPDPIRGVCMAGRHFAPAEVEQDQQTQNQPSAVGS